MRVRYLAVDEVTALGLLGEGSDVGTYLAVVNISGPVDNDLDVHLRCLGFSKHLR